jgi:hypothetical protein
MCGSFVTQGGWQSDDGVGFFGEAGLAGLAGRSWYFGGWRGGRREEISGHFVAVSPDTSRPRVALPPNPEGVRPVTGFLDLCCQLYRACDNNKIST